MTKADLGTRNTATHQRGVSIIAALFIIVILAFMGLMLASLVSTGSLTAVGDLQSTQALSVAEGGVQYEQLILAQNVEWYRGPDPVDTTTQALGAGSVTSTSNIPATMLRTLLTPTSNTANVYSTSRFLSSGYLQIEDDVASGAEFVQYTGVTNSYPYQFTNVTRGRTIGSVATKAGTHQRVSNVYPVSQLQSALASNCSSTASITITGNPKFLSAGTISILGEEINYTGMTVSGTNMILTGIQRCVNATSSAAAGVNDPVTPMLDLGANPNNQAEIVSTGTVGGALRTVKNTVQR
jgi:hypothetical protein